MNPWKRYKQAPWYLKHVKFDLIIFFTELMGMLWIPGAVDSLLKNAGFLKDVSAIKVATTQDENYAAQVLNQFINQFNINYVFSVAPESEWKKIYPLVDHQKVKFFRTLTGYLDEETILKINRLASTVPTRSIDIGYRAHGIRHYLGRHGYLKIKIAEVFSEKASAYGIVTDISTQAKDLLFGDDWYRFLLGIKYTIGIEGGATLLDWDRSVGTKTIEYVAEHPDATFDEVEAACFPNRDGQVQIMALSPRHLEACVTRTCQVLIEGEYNGILKPGVHYIEVKRDFSNLDEVLRMVKEDKLRHLITEQAYQDVVASGANHYDQFVRFILKQTLGESVERIPRKSLGERIIYKWMQFTDQFSWVLMIGFSLPISILKRIMPAIVLDKIVRYWTTGR